jgi:hypothetical protein
LVKPLGSQEGDGGGLRAVDGGADHGRDGHGFSPWLRVQRRVSVGSAWVAAVLLRRSSWATPAIAAKTAVKLACQSPLLVRIVLPANP